MPYLAEHEYHALTSSQSTIDKESHFKQPLAKRHRKGVISFYNSNHISTYTINPRCSNHTRPSSLNPSLISLRVSRTFWYGVTRQHTTARHAEQRRRNGSSKPAFNSSPREPPSMTNEGPSFESLAMGLGTLNCNWLKSLSNLSVRGMTYTG